MKIEFHPDFHIKPNFKIIWPRFKELFGGFKFTPENYHHLKRKVLTILSLVLVLIIVVLLVIKFVSNK